MRAAIAAAEVGDDVYHDDPTVNSLESRVANLFGKDAAVFTPSGSLANQLAIRTLVRPGEELLAEANSHIVRAELGAAAVFSGITTRTWSDPRGALNVDSVMELARPDSGPYLVSTTAIAVENTHNFGGGTVQPIQAISELSKRAHDLGIKMHLDGARIWNAHIASAISFEEFGRHFDTISVCLSKGLGAPIGSLMIADHERVESARVWRKRYGAGMRQVGLLAAAGHFALDNNLTRLADDHRRAKELARTCHQVAPTCVDPNTVETNIVGLDLHGSNLTAAQLAAEAKDAGVLVSALGPSYLRLVTHLDFTEEHLAKAKEVLSLLLQRAFMSK